MDATTEINLLLEECLRLARTLPAWEMHLLVEERAQALGCSTLRADSTAGMAILQMSRDKEPWPVPKWAGPEMAVAIEKAREYREALAMGREMGRH